MSEELKAQLANQAKLVNDLVSSGQWSDAFLASQELQRQLVLAQTGLLERVRAGMRELLELK